MRRNCVPLEGLMKASNGSVYELTILLAKRALYLADGGKSLLDKPGDKILENALHEIAEGKLRVKCNKG